MMRALLQNQKLVLTLMIAISLLLAFNAVIVPLTEIPLHVIKNPNEGWNAFFTARAMSGLTIYPQAPLLLVNNYPPLSFYLVGLVGSLTGDNILAGRIVSVLSLLVIAANLGLITARRAASPLTGIFIASYFIAVFSVFPGGRFGLDDPQLLGHAVMLTGLSMFWLGGAGFVDMLGAAALMVGAGLIKHNIVAVPLGVTLWLALFDRKRLGTWLGAAALCAVVAIALCAFIWGAGFFESLLTPRQTTLSKLGTAILLLREMAPSLTLFAFLLFYPPSGDQDRRKMDGLAILYVLIALATGFFFYIGAGVSSNAFFDVVIGVVLGIGVLLTRLPGPPARTAMIVALVAGQLLMVTMGLPKVLNGSISRQVRQDQADIDYLAAHPGKAICSDLTLCYWAGEEFALDLFNMDQLYTLHKRDPQALFASLRQHDFSMVVLDNDHAADDSADPFMDAFRQTLLASYRIARRSDRFVFYAPR